MKTFEGEMSIALAEQHSDATILSGFTNIVYDASDLNHCESNSPAFNNSIEFLEALPSIGDCFDTQSLYGEDASIPECITLPSYKVHGDDTCLQDFHAIESYSSPDNCRQKKGLVIFDSSLPFVDQLIQKLDDTHLLVSIDYEQNPFEKISNAIHGFQVDNINIIAHGSAGKINIGTGIDLFALRDANSKGLLSTWNPASIRIWSCEVAANPEFIREFSNFTGSHIIASDSRLGQGISLVLPEKESLISKFIEELPFQLIWLGSNYYSNYYGTRLAENLSTNYIGHNGGIFSLGGNDTVTVNHGSNGKIDLGHGNDNAYVRSNWLSYNWPNTGLYGGDGDDVINSTWNHSLINGGSGDDSLHVNDNRGQGGVEGGDGSDDIYAKYNHGWMAGGDGNDIVEGRYNWGRLYAGDGNDHLIVRHNHTNAYVYGGSGSDDIDIEDFNHGSIYGENGNDDIRSIWNRGTISGGYGDDVIDINYSWGNLLGGAGDDLLKAIHFHRGSVMDSGSGDDVINISDYNYGTILSDSGNDNITVKNTNGGTINSGSGNDEINVRLNRNEIDGGDGDDVIRLDTNQEVASKVYGGLGDDVLYLSSENSRGVVDGGQGEDTLNTDDHSDELTGGNNGTIGELNYNNFENINLGGGSDVANVIDSVNVIDLGDGLDIANLAANASGSIDGGQGIDNIRDQSGDSELETNSDYGGTIDEVSYSNFEIIDMGSGVDQATVSNEFTQLNLDGGADIAILKDGASGSIDGGEGDDKLIVNFGETLFQTSDANSGLINGISYQSFESIDFVGGNDHGVISHQVGENSMHLGSGNDVVEINQGTAGRIMLENDDDTVNLSLKPDGHNELIILDGGNDIDALNFINLSLEEAGELVLGGEMGDFTNYASDPTGETFDSDLFNLSATNFENVNWNKSSQDSNAVSDTRLVGVSETTVVVDDDLSVDYDVNGNSQADASGVSAGASAYSELITIGVEDSDFDAADGVSFDLDFGGVSSASSSSTSEGSDAVAVGFGLGFDGIDGIADTDANVSGSELDLAISNVSGVMADAESIIGDVMAVSSNDIVAATELMVVADASVQAALSADVQTISIATTTAGSSEAVGWQDVSVLEDSNVTSGGLGLIDVDAQAMNSVSAESVGVDGVGVGGIVTADAISHSTGISETDFSFADTESTLSADLSDSTSASATSVFGDAVSSLTSSIKGIFGGSSPNTIENAESISAIVNEQGFAEASSVGGTAVSTADQSAIGMDGYAINNSSDLQLTALAEVDSTADSSATMA